MNAETPCTSDGCDQPAVGLGPFSNIPLCEQHMIRDNERVRERKTKMVEKLEKLTILSDTQQQLQLEKQSLEAEVHSVNEAFQKLLERQKHWQKAIESKLQGISASMGSRLSDSTKAANYLEQVAALDEQDEMRQVMELTVSAADWLDEAAERNDTFAQMRTQQGTEASGNLRCVGDVTAGVESLMTDLDRQMAGLISKCRLDVESRTKYRYCEPYQPMPVITIQNSEPTYVAVCTNTTGFAGDSSDRVAKADTSSGGTQLQQPCIFVAFVENSADYLLVVSLNGESRLKCCIALEQSWSAGIGGLHCDSRRQLLFVAQPGAVTVADLSGQVKKTIKAEDLRKQIGEEQAVQIRAIAGGPESVFLLGNNSQMIFSIDPDSLEQKSAIRMREFCHGGLTDLGLHGTKILVVDQGDDNSLVHAICSISGQRIVTYNDACHRDAIKLTLDNNGVIFATECGKHRVRAVSSDGLRTVQLMGSTDQLDDREFKFNWPLGLATLALDAATGSEEIRHLLIVVDKIGKRLQLFETGVLPY